MLRSVNPATGQTLREYPEADAREQADALQAAHHAFEEWRHAGFSERAAPLRRAAALLRERQRDYAVLMAAEMGKPVAQGRPEAEKCAWVCEWFAENGKALLAPEEVKTDAARSFVTFAPLGVVLAIMPWNFPFWQVFRFAAPALMAGNVGVLKHASNVPQCALAIEDIFRRAGFTDGAFQTLIIGSEAVEGLIADSRVAAATLTGSEGAGRSVATAAGKNLKKAVLELGGSDPFVVMPSADLESAIATAVTARMINNGQSCIAAKRFIVHEKIYDDFLENFVARVSAVRIGDPMDEKTELGPLATAAIRDGLDEQVKKSVAAGARLATGGEKLDREGFYYAPTVLTDIPPQSPAARDELFGPVASVFTAKDITDAIRIANGTPFGLGASAWTRDQRERDQFIAAVESGLRFINRIAT